MSFFDTLFLDSVLIVVPIMCMFLVKANIKSINNIDKKYLIDIANFFSLILLVKFSNTSNTYGMLLINIPFVISIIQDRKIATIGLAIILIFLNVSLGFDLYMNIIEYLIYIILFVILFKIGKSYNILLLSIIFIKGITFTIYDFYILKNDNLLCLGKIFVCLVVFYLIGTLIIHLIDMIEKSFDLNQTLKELEKEKNLKNSLFKITHEVKNPIAVCKGYLSMMDYENIEKVKKYNEIILSELNRTLDIMDNFSEYTKINVKKDIMDLDYLITDTIKNLDMLFESKNIDINYDSSMEVFINGDYVRLKQVLVNVLKNSTEAIKDNGIIDIDLKINKKYAELSIKDNGCGMSKDELSKIDELFYSSKEKGCGIGVSLSKEIIKLHNGFIKYKSKEGEYTKVIIRLPLEYSFN